jgi:hypothetical protein
MNPALAYLLMRLYPRAWRERYAAEFEEFLKIGDGGLRASANVVLSAFYERLFPTRGAKTDQPSDSFQYWCVRAPWAMFVLFPILVLAVAYFFACLYLWFGWRIFLPAADTPFGQACRPIYGAKNIYFQAGKFYYLCAPILVGWAIELIAARQRVKSAWLIVGLVPIAWIGSAAQIHASRTGSHGGLGYIGMDFPLGSSIHSIYESPLHAVAIFFAYGVAVSHWAIAEDSIHFRLAGQKDQYGTGSRESGRLTDWSDNHDKPLVLALCQSSSQDRASSCYRNCSFAGINVGRSHPVDDAANSYWQVRGWTQHVCMERYRAVRAYGAGARRKAGGFCLDLVSRHGSTPVAAGEPLLARSMAFCRGATERQAEQ